MTRLTVAALHRMAKAAQAHDHPVVTIATHPESRANRYTCWPVGCILLPHALVEDLAFPADGTYAMTGKGLGEPVDVSGFNGQFAAERMLPLLDAAPRIPIRPSAWLYERGPLTMRLLDRGDRPAAAVNDDLWQAWTRALDGPMWQAVDRALRPITWASSGTARAHGLLNTIHHRYVPTPPEEAP
ncbi:hypothetical protein GCM10009530_63340 [Microbispora corallina]|uniref:Uncharacterized protein n=1 Tax=Microbispora corallina TaxID=83302 RepID=A0ABQ4GBQ2_9ACTN|nr:hypothetical protein [Microbispora corallina]GIH44436.1 hypothetical protein Mco01_74360 [Microbispora corallina]